MPVLKRCCCCCRLRTGVTVLGWLGLVQEIIIIAVTALAISTRHDRVFSNINKQLGGKLNIDVWLALQMSFAVVGLLTYAALLWGAIHGNRFFLVPWLFMGMSQIVLSFAVYIVVLIAVFHVSAGLGVFGLISGLVVLGIGIYIWLCVFSCFQELRDNCVTIPQVPIQSISVTQEIPYNPAFTVPAGSVHATDMCEVVK